MSGRSPDSPQKTDYTVKKHIFKSLSLLTGLLYLWLFYQLLFTPAQMLRSFNVDADVHTIHLAQRISALMLGFAVLIFLALPLQKSRARAIIAAAVTVNMAGFAINSLWGAAHGLLTDGAIPVIGGIETCIALAYGCYAVCDLIPEKKPGTKSDRVN